MTIRPARPTDIDAIARIWNQGIEDRCATFETEPRTPARIEAVLAGQGGRPFLVGLDRGGDPIGFAASSEYRPRTCYLGVGEVSVYVLRAARGCGAGLALLGALADACAARGDWKLVGRLFADNQASRRLCARAGFREVGVYLRHGRLHGMWKDCVIVERLLGAALE